MAKKCSNCNRDMVILKDKYFCPFCHLEEPFERSEKQDIVEVSCQEKLLSYLKTTNVDIDVLNSLSKDLCKENPASSLGKLFLAYTKRITKPNDFKKTISNYVIDEKENDNKPQVIDYIIKHSDYKFILYLENELNNNKMVKSYAKLLKETKDKLMDQHEKYSLSDADVFICYSSSNLNHATKIADYLEEAGISCWYAERNMSKNNPIDFDYKKVITNVICNCKVFLVLTSLASMYSEDVDWEIKVAEAQNIDKRVEYLLENSCKHTKNFDRFFDGKQWIDGSNCDHLNVLLERISYLLKEDDTKPEVKSTPKKEESKEAKPTFIPEPPVEQAKPTFIPEPPVEQLVKPVVKKVKPEPIVVKPVVKEEPEPVIIPDTPVVKVVNPTPVPIVKPAKTVKDGINAYKAKKYDEAIEILKLYHSEDKRAAGYIGIIYAERQEYEKAYPYLVRTDLEIAADPLNEVGKYLYRQKEYTKSFTAFSCAGKLGSDKALYNLAISFKYGNGCEKSEKLALRYYNLSAKLGNVKASTEAGSLYMDQDLPFYNPSLALERFKFAAEKNDPRSCFLVAKMYYNGFGTKKDMSLFNKYLKKAIDLGYEPATAYKEYINEENDNGCALELDDIDF